MKNQTIVEVSKVEKLKTYDVTFRDGTSDTRERLQIVGKVDVWDDLLEEFDTEDQYFTFWGDQAVEAAKALKEGSFLYIKDFREKELPPNETYSEPIITRNIKQFKLLAREKAEKVRSKIKDLMSAQEEVSAF